jgi:hypothetical protein
MIYNDDILYYQIMYNIKKEIVEEFNQPIVSKPYC